MSNIRNRKNLKSTLELVSHVYCRKCKQHTILFFTQCNDLHGGFFHIHIHPELYVGSNDSPNIDEKKLEINLETKNNGDKVVYCPLCNKPIKLGGDYSEFEFTTDKHSDELKHISFEEKLPKKTFIQFRIHFFTCGEHFATPVYNEEKIKEVKENALGYLVYLGEEK